MTRQITSTWLRQTLLKIIMQQIATFIASSDLFFLSTDTATDARTTASRRTRGKKERVKGHRRRSFGPSLQHFSKCRHTGKIIDLRVRRWKHSVSQDRGSACGGCVVIETCSQGKTADRRELAMFVIVWFTAEIAWE
jgi:hypothetical protein